MMHKLRHPIVMFVVTVLAVIGIGVGVGAATTNQKVYGPPWGRFSVAFPGPIRGDGGRTSTQEGTVRPYSVYSYSNSPSGWRGHTPYLSESVSVVGGGAIRRVLPSTIVSMSAGYPNASIAEQQMNGFSVVTFGPSRRLGPWAAASVTSNGRVLWAVVAVSTASRDAVEDFLASFQPIG